MGMQNGLANWAKHQSSIDTLWGYRRRTQLHAAFRQRMDHYAQRFQAEGLTIDETVIEREVQSRIKDRGYTPTRRRSGEVHTFAFIPKISWHAALYPDLEALGPVSHYDYAAHGFTWEDFYRRDSNSSAARRTMLGQFRDALRAAHAERPVDWIFIYASGIEITADDVRELTEEFGIPVVNMCLDDKQSWTGPKLDGKRFGQIELAPVFDLSWTSARVARQWYRCEGGRPIYLPEGFDPRFYKPMQVERDIPVSFIGGAYGFRRSMIRDLNRSGIPVRVFGPGWGTESVWGEAQVAIINRSQINLGSGGIGYSEMLTNVKTRDFEIPGTGGGLYLTTFNPDLTEHFEIGSEIACYHSREEMITLIRQYLAEPEQIEAISKRARARCLAEHRWLHRYERICGLIGVLDAAKTQKSQNPAIAA
jgi:hypothetical protein